MGKAQRPKLNPVIQGLVPTLVEVGKIKIGRKGALKNSGGGKKFHQPEKLDHFLITTLERGPDSNFLRDEEVHKALGQKPTEIPIRLLYNDLALNFQSSRACFVGQSCHCRGDGINAYRKVQGGGEEVVSCPCERADPNFSADTHKCKVNGILSVVLDDMQIVGGVYKFRTTGFNSVINIMSSLSMLHTYTRGTLAGIPLVLALRPKAAVIPSTQTQTKIYTVGIHYRGSTEELQEIGYRLALRDREYQHRIEHIEENARANAGDSFALTYGETEADIAQEYFPEEVIEETGAKPVEPEPDPDPVPAPDPEPEPDPGQSEDTLHFDTKFSGYSRTTMDKFIAACVANYSTEIQKVSSDEIKNSACEHPDRFIAAYEKWAEENGLPLIEPKTEPEPAKEDPDQEFVAEWWSKREAGFSTYVFKNMDRFESCSPETREKARDKWLRLYRGTPWPLDMQAEIPENHPNGKYGEMIGPEDKDMGTTSEPGTPNTIEQDFFPEEQDETITEMVNSNEYQEMQALQRQYPEMYAEVTNGLSPRNIKEAMQIISIMDKKIDALKGASVNFGGMPGA